MFLILEVHELRAFIVMCLTYGKNDLQRGTCNSPVA